MYPYVSEETKLLREVLFPWECAGYALLAPYWFFLLHSFLSHVGFTKFGFYRRMIEGTLNRNNPRYRQRKLIQTILYGVVIIASVLPSIFYPLLMTWFVRWVIVGDINF